MLGRYDWEKAGESRERNARITKSMVVVRVSNIGAVLKSDYQGFDPNRGKKNARSVVRRVSGGEGGEDRVVIKRK